ncbi:hypothetical protein ACJJTC_014534 [Scirpophaga incertulas]
MLTQNETHNMPGLVQYRARPNIAPVTAHPPGPGRTLQLCLIFLELQTNSRTIRTYARNGCGKRACASAGSRRRNGAVRGQRRKRSCRHSPPTPYPSGPLSFWEVVPELPESVTSE